MFVQLQFDQEARRAMILQSGQFKDPKIIFCRFLSWSWFYEYFIYLNAVISNCTFGAQLDIYAVSLLFHGISWYFWKKEIQCLINLLLSMKCNWKNSTISLSNIILFGGFWCSKTGFSIGSGVDLKHGLLDTEEDITGCVTEFCGDSLSSLLLHRPKRKMVSG